MLTDRISTAQYTADFFIEIAFGFEVSNGFAGEHGESRGVKHGELPDCFGLPRHFLRCQQHWVPPEVDPEQEVNVTTLAFLWHRWFCAAKNSARRVMDILAAQQSEERRRTLAVLEFAKRQVAKRKAKTKVVAEGKLTYLKSFCCGTPSTGATQMSDAYSRHSRTDERINPRDSTTTGRHSRSSNLDALISPHGATSPLRSRKRCEREPLTFDDDTEAQAPSTPLITKASEARRMRWVPWSAGQVDVANTSVDVEQIEVDLASETLAEYVPRTSASSALPTSEQSLPSPSDSPLPPGRSSPLTLSTPPHAQPIRLETEVVPTIGIRTNDSDEIHLTPPAREVPQPCASPGATIVSRADRTFSKSASARTERRRRPLNTLTPSRCQISQDVTQACERTSTRVTESIADATEMAKNSLLLAESQRTSTNHVELGLGERSKLSFMGVSQSEFRDWFRSPHGLAGMMKDELADAIWLKAAEAAEEAVIGRRWQLLRAVGKVTGTPREARNCDRYHPTWCQLRGVMDTWSMPRGERPHWFTHLGVCMQRYARKYIRTRYRTYLLLVLTSLLGALCGILHGGNPDRNDCLIFYMLFNTMFGSICATALVGAFGGGRESADFLRHEAYSGVSQTAEGLARITIDLVPLALLSPSFALPLLSFGSMRAAVVVPWMAFAWAMSPLGYIFTLMAPGNANVLTTCTTFVICAFANGFFGIKLSMITSSMRWMVKLSPGFSAFKLVSVASALAEPFSTKRWALLRQLRGARMIPQGKSELLQYELEHVDWVSVELKSLLLVGLVLRVVAMVFFYARSNFQLVGRTEHARIAILQGMTRSCLRTKAQRLSTNSHASISQQAAHHVLQSRLSTSRATLEDPRSRQSSSHLKLLFSRARGVLRGRGFRGHRFSGDSHAEMTCHLSLASPSDRDSPVFFSPTSSSCASSSLPSLCKPRGTRRHEYLKSRGGITPASTMAEINRERPRTLSEVPPRALNSRCGPLTSTRL